MLSAQIFEIQKPNQSKPKPQTIPSPEPAPPVAANNASQWLQDAFGDIVVKSQPKAYLFKLLEFNKIEIEENNRFLAQNTELEYLFTKFMCFQVDEKPEELLDEEKVLLNPDRILDPDLLEVFSQIEETQS